MPVAWVSIGIRCPENQFGSRRITETKVIASPAPTKNLPTRPEPTESAMASNNWPITIRAAPPVIIAQAWMTHLNGSFEDTEYQSPEKKKRTGLMILLGAVSLVLIALLIAGGYLFSLARSIKTVRISTRTLSNLMNVVTVASLIAAVVASGGGTIVIPVIKYFLSGATSATISFLLNNNDYLVWDIYEVDTSTVKGGKRYYYRMEKVKNLRFE